jgi:fibro-slime domain-containing protein
MMKITLSLILLFIAAACKAGGNPETIDRSTGGNESIENGMGGSMQGTGGKQSGIVDWFDGGVSGVSPSGELMVIIRDFRLYNPNDPSTNPDFENMPQVDQDGNPSTTYIGSLHDQQIVADTLGADGKPVYKNPDGKSLTTHGKAAFDQWFRDVPGTNIRVNYPLQLTSDPFGYFVYDSQQVGVPLDPDGGRPFPMFLPINDGSPYATSFGNEGQAHNYSFTLELHTRFIYRGGEFFTFRGDDDVFVYIDKKLVINLGGIHEEATADLKIDTLGLTKGKEYPLDFFYAERHQDRSNLFLTTSLGLGTE